MGFLAIENVFKTFDKDVQVLKGIDTTMQKGDTIALVGESGCGKTTLLRSIAGFEKPEEGSIRLNGEVLQDAQAFINPEKRNIGFLFQDYALFPHMTVASNIAFGLESLSKADQEQRIDEVLTMLGIESLKKRYPHEISGGQQQRVALARALAPSPKLLLMDEPFSNIDNMIKDQVRTELKSVLREAGITTILVTHDMEDAMIMADEILVMKDGQILQQAIPNEMYQNPVDSYVAGFFGKANWLTVMNSNTGYSTALGKCNATQEGKLLVRPEDIVEDTNGVVCEVLAIQYRGSYFEVKVTVGSETLVFNSASPKEHLEKVHLTFRKDFLPKVY